MKHVLYIILLLIYGCSLSASTVMDRSFDATGINHLLVSNIFGDVTAKRSTNNKIQIKAVLVDGSIQHEMKLDYKVTENAILVYISSPCTTPKSELEFDPENPLRVTSWRNNCHWSGDNDIEPPHIDFSVSLPDGISLYAATVNEGDIAISNVKGDIWTQNVNGAVTIVGANQVKHASTINGEVNVELNRQPNAAAKYSTINGDIRVKINDGINANATFKSFSGDFFTDIEPVKMLPALVERQSKKTGFEYKVEELSRMQLGTGGVTLAFETFNGDAYLVVD